MSSLMEKLGEEQLLAAKYADNGIELTIQEVTASCDLACEVNLERVARRYRGASYNPKRFAAVIMRLRSPKTTAFVERSGKMVVTGAKSEADARTAAGKFAKIVRWSRSSAGADQLQRSSQHVRSFRIQHMLGSCNVPFPINLEAFAKERAERGTEGVGTFTAF